MLVVSNISVVEARNGETHGVLVEKAKMTVTLRLVGISVLQNPITGIRMMMSSVSTSPAATAFNHGICSCQRYIS